MGSTTIAGTNATSGSSATLTTTRDRVEQTLVDTTNAKWATGIIDEAIRAAIAAYEQVHPHTAIASLTLTVAGREISIASLTYSTIQRVWWDYDSTSPDHPPRWRDFEVWPGNILYVNDAEEPGVGDVVRVWYTAPHTLNGLDGASTTTILDAHITHLVIGACGYSALSRAVDRTEELNVDGWDFERLRKYAGDLLSQFNSFLQHLASQHATRSSGIAAAPVLDRWENAGW